VKKNQLTWINTDGTVCHSNFEDHDTKHTIVFDLIIKSTNIAKYSPYHKERVEEIDVHPPAEN
jgi:hypothetical protein